MADADFAETHFPQWLTSLPDDIRALGSVVGRDDVPSKLRAPLVGALNYAFKQLDIIPDWFDSLGYIDDALILRVGAAMASDVDAGEADGEDLQAMYRLGNDAERVKELLGDDLYDRLVTYVEALPTSEIRGRTADLVLSNADKRATFLLEVEDLAADFKEPAYQASEKHPAKVRWIIQEKLPK